MDGESCPDCKASKKGTYTLTGSISEPQFSVIDAGYVDSGSSRFTSAKIRLKKERENGITRRLK